MAEQQAAWGIEIGQAGLKAIRLRYAEAADQVLAVAFDYVPHPKLLSQPDANPEELIRQALDTFLSRNKIGSDLVAIGLPGQSALAKFIQLPPVESSKVAEIVKYEARQQIPFALEEVIWDYQTLGSGSEEGGFLLDAEVGLIAMKREAVNQHLKPFSERKIEVEAIQIAPLALYNYVCYDRLGLRPGVQMPSDTEYTVLLDMGADNTTLMVTNGRKIWIRNVPVGGNHFTRALTKEMKLTFAKAEHLKCNATKSPDPRAVFQALRPVFNDYVTEIQRSIGYFASVNRQAKISRLLGCGNGFKLAGLQKFLQQNLQYDVERVESFPGLAGDHVLHAPLFQDNLQTFTVPYGLALQALGRTTIQTSLLPPEIASARLIRRKKPWAVAAAAALLFGLTISTAGFGQVYESVSKSRFGKFEDEAESFDKHVKMLKGSYDSQVKSNASMLGQGSRLVNGLDERELWLEVYKAIDECLPRDPIGVEIDDKDIAKMERISLRAISMKWYEDLNTWFEAPRGSKADDDAYVTYMNKWTPKASETPPSGNGYVVSLNGVHYHDTGDPISGFGIQYVVATLLKNLQCWEVTNPDPQTGELVTTPVRKLGISHATITQGGKPKEIQFIPGAYNEPGLLGRSEIAGGGPRTTGGAFLARASRGLGSRREEKDEENRRESSANGYAANQQARQEIARLEEQSVEATPPIMLRQQEFVLEFVWVPTKISDRKEDDPLAPAEGADASATEGAPEESN